MDEQLRPTRVTINLDALCRNLDYLKRRAFPNGGGKIMPVVKANAYGHGLIECGRELERAGADALAVAFVEEAIALRSAGLVLPILVLGGLVGTQVEQYLQHDIDITASSIFKLQQIEEASQRMGKRARVHLKIDTGMERVGVHAYSAKAFLEIAASSKHVDVVGLYSHFAMADASDLSFARDQLASFVDVCDGYDRLSGTKPIRHISSTASILQLPEAALDMVRPGLGIYGIAPTSQLLALSELRPVMTLLSEVVYFKVVRAGNTVSYGRTWHKDVDTRVVTLPVGYGDGYPRRLSNCGEVFLHGTRYPIVGTVCMDMCMVDIGNDDAFNGDDVLLWGERDGERITVNEIADIVDTTPHEIVTAITARVPRVFVRDGTETRA